MFRFSTAVAAAPGRGRPGAVRVTATVDIALAAAQIARTG